MPRAARAPRSVDDLVFEGMLGRGTFGTVHLAVNRYSGEAFAVKEIPGTSVRSKLEFLKEAKVLRMAQHPCLLRLVSVFVKDAPDGPDGTHNQLLYLVTEFCAGGSLSGFLVDENVRVLPWHTRIRFALECARGLNALHENNLIHRDLKSENCLLKAVQGVPPDRSFSHFSIVLGDFGLARWYATNTFPRKKSKRATVRGTPWTMAPELMNAKSDTGYTTECDIFSLGVVLLEIACRTPAICIPRDNALSVDMALVESMSTEPPKRVRVRRSSIRDSCPHEYLELVKQCVEPTPHLRPPIESVVDQLRSQYALFRGGDDD